MKILFFDIETAPCLAYVWGMYNEVTSSKMMEKDWYCLCWCAKWLGQKEILTGALPDHTKLYKKEPDNDKEVMQTLWDLLDEADVVVAHNAVKFDVKKVNTRFILNGMPPPSPFKTLDTLLVARRYFSFTSNRLGDLGQYLDVGSKEATGGFELWRGCMRGDKKSWHTMVKYCKQDVRLLEKVYKKMLPFIKTHPNISAHYRDRGCCPKCGSTNLISNGTRTNMTGINQEYKCGNCKGYSTKRIRNWTKEEKSKFNIMKNA